MTLNRTAIEWCDATWNPVTGCLHGCAFCYARKIAHRFNGTKAFPHGFEPTVHPDRFDDPADMKKPKVIFVCSMADLFGSWVPQEWIEQVISSCLAAPQHTYIFLTKNPLGMRSFFKDCPIQKNFWLGTSCGESKESWNRIVPIMEIGGIDGWNTLLSVEPLKVMCPSWGNGGHIGINWIIIGMQTNPLTPCQLEVLTETIGSARRFDIPVFMKDSVKECFPKITMRREYPEWVRV